MAQVTRAAAQAAAEVIRNETTANANTANRVGGLHRDMTDSVMWNNNGLASARPGSGAFAGDTYFATDTGVLSFWDGAAWQNFSASPVSGLTDARLVVADGTDDLATDNISLAAGVMAWETGDPELRRGATVFLKRAATATELYDVDGDIALSLAAAAHQYTFAGDTYQLYASTGHSIGWDGVNWITMEAAGLTANAQQGSLTLQRGVTGVFSADGTQNVLRDAGGSEALHLRAAFHAYDFSGDNYQNYSAASHTLGWNGNTWVALRGAGLLANAVSGDLTLQCGGTTVFDSDGTDTTVGSGPVTATAHASGFDVDGYLTLENFGGTPATPTGAAVRAYAGSNQLHWLDAFGTVHDL